MLRSIAELAAYGVLATLLTLASLVPAPTGTASSAAAGEGDAPERTIRVEGSVAKPTLSAGQQRGALLFTAKGCIGCHTHAAFPSARMNVGPDLTSLAARAGTRVAGLDAPAYVRQSLREPRAFLASGYAATMPDLALTDEEIQSLTAFLLSSDR